MAESQKIPVNPLANATYFASAHEVCQLPPPGESEVAFAGRSNAGKSSAINRLVSHNRLAFVSKTPGRTQMINFFKLPAGGFLVDLPGYGFAKVPHTERARWGGLISDYLSHRSTLSGLVCIMDIRHPLTALDRQLLDWFLPWGKPLHVLLTKADKLSRQQSRRQLELVRDGVAGLGDVSVQLFSSLSGEGMDTARARISGWIKRPDSPEAH